MKKYIFLACVAVFGCQPNVLFEEAMPPGIGSLDLIPELFQGIYLCESDQSRIVVHSDRIIQKSNYVLRANLSDIAENDSCMILGDSLYFTYNNTCVPIETTGGNKFRANVFSIDTLFSLEYNVAKYYKGHLFLNIQHSSRQWSTWIMSPAQDHVTIELIDLPADLTQIQDVSQQYRTIKSINGQHERYVLNPTLSEFQELLKNNYILKCELLRKIADPIF